MLLKNNGRGRAEARRFRSHASGDDRMMLRALLCVGIWMASLAAFAAESSGVFGMGAKPCREVTAMSADPNARKVLASWMEGYLSGLNYEHVKANKKYLDAGSLT